MTEEKEVLEILEELDTLDELDKVDRDGDIEEVVFEDAIEPQIIEEHIEEELEQLPPPVSMDQWKCSYWSDPECTKKLDSTSLFLGEAWIGKRNEVTIWVRNDDKGKVRDMKWLSTDPMVEIHGPTSMLKGEVAKLTFIWSPPRGIEKGLKAQIKVTCIIVFE